MNHSHFSNPSWYLALGLSERARLLSRDERPTVSETAHQRLLRWKSQRPFASGEWLLRRLADDGLDLASFEGALTLSAADLQARARRPEWLAGLEGAFAAATAEITPKAFIFSTDDRGASDLLNLAGPLLESARSRLRAALAPLEGRPPLDVESTSQELISIISRRVLHAIERALVLEMHVAKLEDRLVGETPEARFESFARSLAEKDRAASVFMQYPVLARRVVERIDNGVAAATEFATRLVEDWAEMRATFFHNADPGRLVEIDGYAGDSHRRGRSVVIARFESGARVVYKPRPLDVDVHFQEFLRFLNTRLDGPPLRTLAVLPKHDYGWLEFVEVLPCESRDDAHRYYWRVGGLLAALHALRGVDCHFENIIAHGDQPVLVDLETVLHPAIPHREADSPDRRFAGRVLTQSVLRVGLLPIPLGGVHAPGIDLSGVASVEGVMSPDRVLQWEKRGTDEMHAVRAQVEMTGAHNRAQLNGVPLNAFEFRDDVTAGFAAVYRLIVRHRDELLAPDGPVTSFAHDQVRAVIRATRAYGMLLSESLHPDLLRDAVDRDRFFDRLWVGIDEHPALARVVGAEHRDLSRTDVPYFTCRPDSRDLWTSDGERIADFFERPAIDLVRERILAMDESDLAQQQWFVTLSLGSLATDDDDSAAITIPSPNRMGHGVDEATLRARMVDEAMRIGERLREIAVWDGDDVAWVALEFRERKWLLEPVSNDLYVGLPGVALFLGYLARGVNAAGRPVTRELEHLARAAAGTVVRTTANANLGSVGAFAGWGGVLYALTHLCALWRDPDMHGACDRIVRRIDELAAGDEDMDMVSGLAGAIGGLCAAHAARVSDSALAVATRCGEHLIARAHEAESGHWWSTKLYGDTPSTGFSHGNAGIAWSLLNLADATGDERFRTAGLSATAFERERLRVAREAALKAPAPATARDRESSLIATWCYGAPGIGISRLRALSAMRQGGAFNGVTADVLQADVDQAVRTTLENGFGRNHCLCHGDLGDLDFLLLARAVAREVNGAPLADWIRSASHEVLASIQAKGWLSGTPAHVPSPGLMNGLAGIGYGLLRMADPSLVPSALALEPPRLYDYN